MAMNDFIIFSKNGNILPLDQAQISLLNIEYSYGYGVYETLKVRNKKLYFIDYHLERLQHSAEVIEISLPFSKTQIRTFIEEYVQRLNTNACNIKMLLIGGTKPSLYIFASAPLFPDRKLYKNGASMISYVYERLFPTAKTLNMLPSYIAYKKAKAQGCYDALLVDKDGIMLEGTRTNFCLIKDKTIFRAPAHRVLEGVTFLTLTKIADQEGFEISEKEIPLQDLALYDCAFITSTSTKIMPVTRIDTFVFPSIPDSLKKIMNSYEEYLDNC